MREFWKRTTLAAAVACALAPSARADAVLALSGADVGAHSFYGYVGVIGALNGDLSKSGFVARLWSDRLSYDFISNGKVNAESWGESASAGYQYAHPGGTIVGYAGVDTRNTALSPAVASPAAGQRTGGRFELDADQRLTDDLRGNVIGNFVTGTKDYWTRGQVLYNLPHGLSAGPELTFQGNPNYDSHRIGAALAGVPLGARIKATFDAGVEKSDHWPTSAYAGAGVELGF